MDATMKRLLSVLLYCIIAVNLTFAQENPPMEGFNAAESDAKAIEIADAVMEAMGGRENWDNTRYLVWGFFDDDQVWDKWTGDYRYQRDSLVVLMNVNTKEGNAWADGQKLDDPSDALSNAYRAWVNSGYWLIMPYKLKDSGVTLKYVGEGATEEGQPAEILQLTFQEVGLTPDNKYLVHVDKESMLVSQWSYFPNYSDEEPRWSRPWANWQQFGAIMLSDERGMTPNGPFTLPHIGAPASLPENIFMDPTPVDPGFTAELTC